MKSMENYNKRVFPSLHFAFPLLNIILIIIIGSFVRSFQSQRSEEALLAVVPWCTMGDRLTNYTRLFNHSFIQLFCWLVKCSQEFSYPKFKLLEKFHLPFLSITVLCNPTTPATAAEAASIGMAVTYSSLGCSLGWTKELDYCSVGCGVDCGFECRVVGWLEKFHRSIIHLIRMTSAPTSGIRRALNRNYDSGGERTTKCSSKQFSPLAAIKSLRAFYDPSFTIRIKRHLSVPSLPDEEQGRYHLYRPLLTVLPVRGEIIFIIV